MRRALAIGLVLLAGLCLGQGIPNLSVTEKRDVTIVVRKARLGDDLTISVPATYPKPQLQGQIAELGRLLGSEVLGLNFSLYVPNPSNPREGYLRALFGLRGLIDREKGVLNLEKIARSFVGGNPPVDMIYIQFETEAPSKNVVQEWRDQGQNVHVQGTASAWGIEYWIKLNTQDASKIHIPEGADAKIEPPAPPKAEPPPRSNVWVWPVVILAALALGALVYSLLLKPRPSARSK